MERIERAFARAVVTGEFERAEGWFAVARWLRSERQRQSVAAARLR